MPRRTLTRLILVSLLALALLLLVGIPLVYVAALAGASRLPVGSPVLRVFDLTEAYRQMGAAGIDCLDRPTLVYEPAREMPDPARVAEPPDRTLTTQLDGHAFVIERVSLSYRSPHAVAWVRFQSPDGQERVRALTLSAGTGQVQRLRLPGGRTLSCYMHTGGWHVVRSEPAVLW